MLHCIRAMFCLRVRHDARIMRCRSRDRYAQDALCIHLQFVIRFSLHFLHPPLTVTQTPPARRSLSTSVFAIGQTAHAHRSRSLARSLSIFLPVSNHGGAGRMLFPLYTQSALVYPDAKVASVPNIGTSVSAGRQDSSSHAHRALISGIKSIRFVMRRGREREAASGKEREREKEIWNCPPLSFSEVSTCLRRSRPYVRTPTGAQ